jgi:hypothetical protein
VLSPATPFRLSGNSHNYLHLVKLVAIIAAVIAVIFDFFPSIFALPASAAEVMVRICVISAHTDTISDKSASR